MNNQQKLELAEDLVKPIYKKIKIWTHGWLHTLNVAKAAKKLAEMEGADVFLCQVAAYCHDLGRLEEEQKNLTNYTAGAPSEHARMSVESTKIVLKEIGVTGQDAKDIIEAVEIHNIRKYEGKNKISLILQDADRADGFGKIAILRFAAFNCQIDIPEPENGKQIDELLDKVTGVFKNDLIRRQKMIHTLEYVFDWRDKLANTMSFKKMVEADYEFNRDYCDKLKSFK